MTTREKPPRSWNVKSLMVLGEKGGTVYLKAIPVLILERWVREGREEGVANFVWTDQLAERLVSSGLVPPFKPKGTSNVLAALSVIQKSRNLTRPNLIENRGEGMFWIRLPHYESLLQEYRQEYCKNYPENYRKLFPPDKEPDWGSPPLPKEPESRDVKPTFAKLQGRDEIQNLLASVEQALRDRQRTVEKLTEENQKLQAKLQVALNDVNEAKTRAETAETKVAQLEKQFAMIKSKSEYIHSSRLIELRAISSQQFDLTRLIELCQELNDNYAKGNVLAVPMLVRAIIDHVPPILGFNTFIEIPNNYNGPKSFKKSMENLQNSLRNIADATIHKTIRSKETLPNSTQIDFSPDLDVLLEEIVRILK